MHVEYQEPGIITGTEYLDENILKEFRLLNECIYYVDIVTLFQLGSPRKEIFNKIISTFVESGILSFLDEYIIYKYVEHNETQLFRLPTGEIDTKLISLYDLHGTFLVLFLGLVLSWAILAL